MRFWICAMAAMAVAASPAQADSSTPVNLVGVNFGPILSSTSSNYDWSTGALTPGTAASSMFSTTNLIQNTVSDPKPPDPNGSGTFIGTGRPVKSPTGGGAVLYEQSVCAEGYPTCLADGTNTFGVMVMRHLRGSTLDQLTNLATMYYVQDGPPTTNCFGGGSPRFSLGMSDGSNIFVYLGTYPSFADCPAKNTWFSTGNLATDGAGLRWDTSQICSGTFYNTYSGAITCANTLGLTVDSISLVTDGGWFGTNGGNSTGQTFLFEEIQVNQVTRFP
jgi:hypothetical protein